MSIFEECISAFFFAYLNKYSTVKKASEKDSAYLSFEKHDSSYFELSLRYAM